MMGPITISVNINRFSCATLPENGTICFIFPFISPEGITMIYLLLHDYLKTLARCIKRCFERFWN